MEWIKWWKDKTFMMILVIMLVTIGIDFLLSCFINWGWILAIAVTLLGAGIIRRTIIKRIEENL